MSAQWDDKIGTMYYPALKNTRWHIESWELSEPDTLAELYELIASGNSPKLAWLAEDKLNLLFGGEVKWPLKIRMGVGGFKASKRLKRFVRPFKYACEMDDKQVNVVYHDEDLKAWDGAGLMHKRMIKRIIDRVPHLTKRQKAIALHKIGECKRFELTMLSHRGEDKGHVFVVDDPAITWDFYLPRDTKTEVAMAEPGITFIGLWDVHSKSEGIWMDMQSLVNLGSYIISPEQFKAWLEREGHAVIERVRNGELDLVLEPMTGESDHNGWITKELVQSGGHVMWSAALAKAAMNAHTDRMAVRTFEKMRFPISCGQRLYIGVDKVVGKSVPKGHAEIDHDSATIWVNHEEWPKLAAIWGGADQDDGMWVLPFKYANGHQRLLIWRSPNQPGEFVVLKPMVKIDGEIPVVRKEDIPARIDERDIKSLGLVEETNYKEGEYSVKAMWPSIVACARNIGALGMICNVLMVAEALDIQFEVWPALLEEIVDAQVKTGADLMPIKQWAKRWAQENLPDRMPAILHGRVEKLMGKEGQLEDMPDHWLSDLYHMALAHVEQWTVWRDEALKECTPPASALEEGEKYIEAGAIARQIYYDTLGQEPEDADFEQARLALMQYLESFDNPEDIALGMLADSMYKRGQGVMKDWPAWVQAPVVRGQREWGPAEYTMMGLRKIGAIGTVERVDKKLALNTSSEPVIGRAITINGVWFSHANLVTGRDATKMAEFTKDERDAFKAHIANQAVQGKYKNQVIQIRNKDNRLIAVKDGLVIGYLAPNTKLDTSEIIIRHAIAHDGNLIATIEAPA